MTHELKIYERYFEQIFIENKNFELRRDIGFNVGDSIVLREIENDSKDKYTDRFMVRVIKYISKNVPQYGLMDGFVVLGI